MELAEYDFIINDPDQRLFITDRVSSLTRKISRSLSFYQTLLWKPMNGEKLQGNGAILIPFWTSIPCDTLFLAEIRTENLSLFKTAVTRLVTRLVTRDMLWYARSCERRVADRVNHESHNSLENRNQKSKANMIN